jgi:hypothetical protein
MSMHIHVQIILELKSGGELELSYHPGKVETVVILLHELSGMLSGLNEDPSTSTGLRWLVLGGQ